jgi:MFS family permease
VTRIRSAFARTFQSMHVRNYRLYFFGQIVSLSGTWMQSVAQAWLVLTLTRSGISLGLVTALQFLPTLVAGPWGGVIADRADKRKLIVGTQIASASLALALGLLTIFGAINVWVVYLLATLLGVVTLVDMPTRQAFVMEMVGPADITNAVSLNGVVVNASRIVGPAVAGLLIATVGIGVCFIVNAVSYIAVIVGLLMMRPDELILGPRAERRPGLLLEGLRYAWHARELRTPLLLMAVVGALSYNFSVVFPLLTDVTFHHGAQAYGTLFSVMGVGAVIGGLVVATRNRAGERFLSAGALALGVALTLGALAPTFGIELGLAVLMGAASTAFIATSNALLQLAARPEMRGRVMALFAMVFLGTTPIGGLLVGWISEAWGPRAGLLVGGVAAVVAGTVALGALWLRARRAAGRGILLPNHEPVSARA